jgi:hypothetical protein
MRLNGLMLCIWLPSEFLFSYWEYHYPHPDDIYFYVKLGTLYFQTVGLIAIAGINYSLRERSDGKTTSFVSALRSGFNYWGRIFITRVVVSVGILIGFLLLILPGLYVAIRFSLSESIVLAEDKSGAAAARRSYNLTKQRFGEILLWWLGGLVPIILAMVAIGCVQNLDALNNWVAQALLTFSGDLLIPVICSLGWAIYLRLAKDEEADKALKLVDSKHAP